MLREVAGVIAAGGRLVIPLLSAGEVGAVNGDGLMLVAPFNSNGNHADSKHVGDEKKQDNARKKRA